MAAPSFLDRLAAAAGRIFGPDESVCIGCSGGPDSSALLHGLWQIRRAGGAPRLHVAHLNHRLRPEADEDESFVRAQAADLELPITVERIAVAELAARSGRGIEETARDERLAFLERAARAAGCTVVALGHTADDNAETVLHRIARGTGLRGLAGIPGSRPISAGSPVRLVRPLLGFRKAELLEFLAAGGHEWRTDASNGSPEFTRNRLRHEVLPLLADAVNPQVTAALLRLARIAGAADELVRVQAAAAADRCLRRLSDDEIELDAGALAAMPEIVRIEVVRTACRMLDPHEGRWGFDELIALSESAEGLVRELPGGLRAERAGGRLRLFRPQAERAPEPAGEVMLAVPGNAEVPWAGATVRAEIIGRETVFPRGATGGLSAGVGGFSALGLADKPPVAPDAFAQADKPPEAPGGTVEVVDGGRIRLPLVVRPPRAGERFRPLGAPGSKSIADFLTDRHVCADQRRRTPLVCDADGPVWVCGHRIADRVRVGEDTVSLLRLSLQAAGKSGGR